MAMIDTVLPMTRPIGPMTKAGPAIAIPYIAISFTNRVLPDTGTATFFLSPGTEKNAWDPTIKISAGIATHHWLVR